MFRHCAKENLVIKELKKIIKCKGGGPKSMKKGMQKRAEKKKKSTGPSLNNKKKKKKKGSKGRDSINLKKAF